VLATDPLGGAGVLLLVVCSFYHPFLNHWVNTTARDIGGITTKTTLSSVRMINGGGKGKLINCRHLEGRRELRVKPEEDCANVGLRVDPESLAQTGAPGCLPSRMA
jgi:hypothetical protein